MFSSSLVQLLFYEDSETILIYVISIVVNWEITILSRRSIRFFKHVQCEITYVF